MSSENYSMEGIMQGGHDGFAPGQQNEGVHLNPQTSTRTLEQPFVLPIQEMIDMNSRVESRLGNVDGRLEQLVHEVRSLSLGLNQNNIVQIEPAQSVSLGSNMHIKKT